MSGPLLETYIQTASVIVKDTEKATRAAVVRGKQLYAVSELALADLENLYDQCVDGVAHEVLCELHNKFKEDIAAAIRRGMLTAPVMEPQSIIRD